MSSVIGQAGTGKSNSLRNMIGIIYASVGNKSRHMALLEH